MGYVLIVLGLVVVGIAIAALVRGHLGWPRIGSRRTAVVVLVSGGMVLGIGGALIPRPTAGTASSGATSPAPSTASSSPTRATTAPSTTAAPSSTSRPSSGSTAAATPDAARSKVWDALAECESSGDWAIDTGNGLYGGLQIARDTWRKYGGQAYAPLPSKASRLEQILIAEKLQADQGFSPWGSCAEDLGLL